MTNNRKTTVAFVIAAAVIAVATASFTARPAATQPSEDFGLRHPDLSQAADPVDSSDYFLRHPELIRVAGVDTSDYALRHPELSRR